MISSTARDLPEHRQKASDACMRLGVFYPDMMEHLTAADANALEVSLEIVDRADLYVGIFAFRYGYVPDGQTISVTEAEYDRATDRGIPRLIFLMTEKHPPTEVEAGEGADKLKRFRERLQKERVVGFFDSADDLKVKVLQALVPYCTQPATKGQQLGSAPQPLIHTLPTQQEIEGRDAECAIILRAMSEGKHRVYAFAAPGGFGKTALLAKVVKTLSPDGLSIAKELKLPNGEAIEVQTSALLHIDCRNDVKLSELFAKAGRLIGQEKQFEEIYNSDATPADKLQEIFSRLSTRGEDRVWFVFDNFESQLSERGEVVDARVRDFFSAVFAGEHDVRALLVGRDVPKFSPRERVEEFEAVGGSLFEGLPLGDSIEFLKKNGAAQGLSGSPEQVDSVLKEFSERVHRVPLALVWAAGYLRDTGVTLSHVLDRQELFADFDKEQARAADRYENRGLKRLHFEQLKIQPSESLPLLSLLAILRRPVPKGALAHLLDEVELNKTLIRLERSKLITRKESADAYTLYLNDHLAINLYGLHPVICENEFFATLPDKEALYETAATECWNRADAAAKVNRFAYAIELYDCAEKLYEHLVAELRREDLQKEYATMLANKAFVLSNLSKLDEAIAICDKAIAIGYRLLKETLELPIAYDMVTALLNKGVALWKLRKLNEAIATYNLAVEVIEKLIGVMGEHKLLLGPLAGLHMNKALVLKDLTGPGEALTEYDKAIGIFERLIDQEPDMDRENDLALVYTNKGVALVDLGRPNEAIVAYDKAIAIRERLVNQQQQVHLAEDLASVYVNKSKALINPSAALAESDKAIVILERLINEEQRTDLSNILAAAYTNKGIALRNLDRVDEALGEYNKAIEIWERLVNQQQQVHLAEALASVYVNKCKALINPSAALAEVDKAIAIRERLVNEEQQSHLADELAAAYVIKGDTLAALNETGAALVEEVFAEYDKAIAILERLVNQEQQTHLSNDLATAYMNKGVCLRDLAKVRGVIVEFDEGIAVLERLVHQEGQRHTTESLALAYLNKAVALERQPDFEEEALLFYTKSLQEWTLCVEDLKMFWVTPKLLMTLRRRLKFLLELQRWAPAAEDLVQLCNLFGSYIETEDLDQGLKEAAQNEVAQMFSGLRALSPEHRELLYTELGDDAGAIRSLVDEKPSE